MTDPISKGLLPEGFRDRLPPQAEAAADLLRTLLDRVSAHGYERVSPPLVEFEDSLVTRLSSARPQDLLRFVDPLSQHSLALRPDITAQVGRIATTRMAHIPRPLRLAYGGPVLRVRPAQVGPQREAMQMGAELIGSDHVDAVAELLGIALEALAAAGLSDMSVDLTLPDLVGTLAGGPWPITAALADMQTALDGKDAAALNALGAARYGTLIEAAGPADAALARLKALDTAGALDTRIAGLERLVATAAPHAAVTIDPTERHGFEYQTWIGFSVFAEGVRGEVGRGGTYLVRHPGGSEEAAVGFSLYVDGLVDAGLGASRRRRVFVPLGTDAALGAKLRAEGWTTLAAFTDADTPTRLRCEYALKDGELLKL
ncbi:ATP phosphoribosyltransferase regulatory subunit [Sphingosinicella soli]|uniref:Histidine--tRNA ligase n=1 Tax=Sphingosinicella soli TaxID=333708 RepID=A0A7W7B4A6_9SPHN|nr:ATP phosphoribosyltransferase regulatory subunit [Sphingosinicella soli]MBB4633732.1 ATP phosphoribosyltransferase regulatory subunit [Sphingosinicella soli]